MEPVLRQRPCAPGRDVPARLISRRRSCRSPSSTSWCRRYRARPSQSRAGPHHRPRRRVGHDRAARHGAERDGDRRAALHHRAVKTVFALMSFAARATDPSGSRAPLAASQMATESLLLLSVNRIVTEVDAPVQPTAGGGLRRGAGDARSAVRAPASQPCGLSAFPLFRGRQQSRGMDRGAPGRGSSIGRDSARLLQGGGNDGRHGSRGPRVAARGQRLARPGDLTRHHTARIGRQHSSGARLWVVGGQPFRTARRRSYSASSISPRA